MFLTQLYKVYIPFPKQKDRSRHKTLAIETPTHSEMEMP